MTDRLGFSTRILATLVVLLAGICLQAALAESVDPPLLDGGFGTQFQQGDIIVSSEVPLSVDIGAAGDHFVDLTVISTAANASLMIHGLRPSTLYYVYLDDFKNLSEHTTTDDGSLSLSFELIEAFLGLPNQRHVMIQDERSTLFITDDATGGDCISIGTWDAATKTCTLNQTVTQTIQIHADGVKLDCNNQIIQKGNGNYGIYTYDSDDSVVKNCIVQGGWNSGIVTSVSNRVEISNNLIDGATSRGIYVLPCIACQVLGNTITNGQQYGLSFAPFNSGTVANNTVTNTKFGWHWDRYALYGLCVDSWYNNKVDGKEVLYLCRADGVSVANTDAYATWGLCK